MTPVIIEAGGHLHVGLEDYADLSGKSRVPTNEEFEHAPTLPGEELR